MHRSIDEALHLLNGALRMMGHGISNEAASCSFHSRIKKVVVGQKSTIMETNDTTLSPSHAVGRRSDTAF